MTIGKSNLVLFFASTFIFMLGIHNIDTAWNLHTVNKADSTLFWFDTNVSGKEIDEHQMYRSGLTMALLGFFTAMLSLIYERPIKKKINQENDDFWKL